MTNQINNGDSVTQSLGKLFRKYGYSRYKMSKFEEYDTYVENKDFYAILVNAVISELVTIRTVLLLIRGVHQKIRRSL